MLAKVSQQARLVRERSFYAAMPQHRVARIRHRRAREVNRLIVLTHDDFHDIRMQNISGRLDRLPSRNNRSRLKSTFAFFLCAYVGSPAGLPRWGNWAPLRETLSRKCIYRSLDREWRNQWLVTLDIDDDLRIIQR